MSRIIYYSSIRNVAMLEVVLLKLFCKSVSLKFFLLNRAILNGCDNLVIV